MSNVILIVEDDPKNMKLVRDLLQFAGYSTIEAYDGKEGIELAREKRPDLILMDLHLPVVGGIEAAQTLKKDPTTKDIPIVALTASAMAGDKEKVLEAGLDGYITKPINVRQFLEHVAEYLS